MVSSFLNHKDTRASPAINASNAAPILDLHNFNNVNPTTNYSQFLSDTLSLSAARGYTALDLFAGCGGLALGFEAAGFETIGYEMDGDGCATYRRNLRGICHEIFLTPETVFPAADIVIGGPPCQPFSVGG